MVDRLNAEHLDSTMLELVEDLHENPPTSSDGAGPVGLESDKMEDMLVEEVSSTMEPPPHVVTAETVKETEYPPVLLARRATVMPVKSQPAHPPQLLQSVQGLSFACSMRR